MCLAIPGRVLEVYDTDGLTMGRVDFDGIVREVCLETVPEIAVGDYALVHVGVALSRIDPDEARQVFEYLRQMNELDALDSP